MTSRAAEIMTLVDDYADAFHAACAPDGGIQFADVLVAKIKNDTLRAALEALSQDAERYRLLRDPQNWTQNFLVVNESESRFTHGDALDAAIDAARKE